MQNLMPSWRTVAIVGLSSLLATSCVTTNQKVDLSKVGRSSAELMFPPPPDEPRFVFERTIRSSADIVPESENSALKRALTGVSDTDVHGLGKPYSIAVHEGKIFVSDSVARVINVFDVPNQKFYRIGDGEDGIAKPLGIDVDNKGNVYIADATLKQILVFTVDGKLLRKIGNSSLFSRLSSVTVDPGGERAHHQGQL